MSIPVTNAQFRYGGMIGGNVSTFVGDTWRLQEDSSTNYSDRWGIQLGVNAEIDLSDVFCVAPSMIFTMKGTTDAHDKEIGVTLDYLEFPLLFQYRFYDQFTIAAGPYMGFLVGATLHDHYLDKNVREATSKYDGGLCFKGIYRMANGLGIHAYYSKGFMDVNYPEGYSGPTRYNASGGVGFSYLFGMK